MPNRIKAMIAAVLIAVTAAALVAAPAHAAVGDDTTAAITDGVPTITEPDDSSTLADIPCASPRLCTYWDGNYNGPMYYYTFCPCITPYCINIGEPWRNDISSVKNRSGYTVKFFSGPNCGGLWTWTLAPGENALDWVFTPWDNTMESFQWVHIG